MREVVVDRADRAVEFELDDRLRLADGRELAFEIRVAQFLLGDVGGVLDDLERLAVHVRDRVVRRLDPDFPAALADALVTADVGFAAVELLPERAVFGARWRSRSRRTGCDACRRPRPASSPDARRKFSFASSTLPSMSNSMTACERPMAAIWPRNPRPSHRARAARSAWHRANRAACRFRPARGIDRIVEMPVLDGLGDRHGIAAADGRCCAPAGSPARCRRSPRRR